MLDFSIHTLLVEIKLSDNLELILFFFGLLVNCGNTRFLPRTRGLFVDEILLNHTTDELQAYSILIDMLSSA